MAFPTIDAISDGLVAVLQAAHPTTLVLDYEPKVADAPLMYVLFAENKPDDRKQQKESIVRFFVRVCINWQENEEAERQLRPYVDSIRNAIKADPWLNGALNKGLASVTEQFADYAEIDGSTFRVLDNYIEVVAKGHTPLTP